MSRAQFVIHGGNHTPSPTMVAMFLTKTGVPHELHDYPQMYPAADMAAMFAGRKNRNDADYIALNPLRSVPTLVHGDVVLTHCTTVLRYVAMAHHGMDSAYYPASDPVVASRMNEFCDFLQTALRPAWMDYVLVKVLGGASTEALTASHWGANVGILANRPNGLVTMVKLFERIYVGDGPFILGRSTPSICDFAALAEYTLIQAALSKDVALPQLAAWVSRMEEYLGDNAHYAVTKAVMAHLAQQLPPAPVAPEGFPWNWY